jgi:DNA-binding CsgD family transcriptional regulator
MAIAGFEQLTDREVEVLALIVHQHSDREISELLDISLNTVYKHVASVLLKLQVESRREAARRYLREVVGLSPFNPQIK